MVLLRDYYFLLFLGFALLVLEAFMEPPALRCFLWCRFLEPPFFAPMFPVAVAAGFAAGFLPPAFLFCAANADVPARANAKTTLIRILFIIVLRRIFLATD